MKCSWRSRKSCSFPSKHPGRSYFLHRHRQLPENFRALFTATTLRNLRDDCFLQHEGERMAEEERPRVLTANGSSQGKREIGEKARLVR